MNLGPLSPSVPCFLALPSTGADPNGRPAGMFLGTQPVTGKAGSQTPVRRGAGWGYKGARWAWWGLWLNGDAQPIRRGDNCSGPAECGHTGKQVRLRGKLILWAETRNLDFLKEHVISTFFKSIG